MFGKMNRIESTLDVDKVVIAIKHLSDAKTGALIVLSKKHDLRQVIDTGEKFNSDISSDLIETIFFKNSPLHDGALIIRDNKIVAARCILPVSKSKRIEAVLGLRHRAAVGITEQTDALALIVSEENGSISYSKRGGIIHQVAAHQLKIFLEKEFIS